MGSPTSRLRQALAKLRSRQKQMASKKKWARAVDPTSLEIADVRQLGTKIKEAWRYHLAAAAAIGQDPIPPSPEEMDVEEPTPEPAPKPSYRIPRKQSNEGRAPLPSHPSQAAASSTTIDLELAQPLEVQALPDTLDVEEPAPEPAPKPSYRIPRKQSNEGRAPLPSHPFNVQQQCSIAMDLELAQPLEEQAKQRGSEVCALLTATPSSKQHCTRTRVGPAARGASQAMRERSSAAARASA